MTELMRITVDDGTREIPIYNQFDEKICVIRFRPGDISIRDRFDALQDALKTLFNPLKQIGINADGTARSEDDWTILKGVEARLIGELNALLDTNDAARIFEKRNAFSRIGDKFFCENIITALGVLIADTISAETAKEQEKLSKYMPVDGGDDDARAASGKPEF